MATIAASAVAAAASLAYLDGKYNLREDWQLMRARSKGKRLMDEAVKAKRVSPYYFIEKRAQQNADKEYIWSRVGCYTRIEVLNRAHQYAQFFLKNGVQPGDLVGLFMANSPDFAFAWIGLWAVGAAPALINHNLTREALLHCLGISEAKIVLADGPEELLSRLDAVREDLDTRGVRIVKLAEVKQDILALSPERPADSYRDDVTPASPFGLFYTSGTTGMPKACVFPCAAGFGYGVSRECGFSYVKGDDQRYYDCMPMYHGTGGISGMTQLLTGQTLCIAPKFSASAFWDDVRDCRATWFVYVGETLRYLLARPPTPRDREHAVHSIYGNGLRPDVWKAFRDRFGIDTVFEFFNSTEGIMPLDNGARGDFRAHAVGFHGLLGRWQMRGALVPVAVDPDTGDIVRDVAKKVTVKDAKTRKTKTEEKMFARPSPWDVGGEILVRQPATATPPFVGYYRNAEATAKKYERDVFEQGDCYYRTGDALRRDADGRWFFVDRLGDTYRWKGENVSTAEVAQALGRFPGVGEATVYGVGVPGHDGKAGMVALYLEEEEGKEGKKAGFDYGAFLRHARTHLPKYAVPIFLRQIKQRSATHNNKQNKVPLKRAGIDPAQMEGDPLLWIDGHGKGDTYVPFTQGDLDSIKAGKAKL